jgi:hypothetical protein
MQKVHQLLATNKFCSWTVITSARKQNFFHNRNYICPETEMFFTTIITSAQKQSVCGNALIQHISVSVMHGRFGKCLWALVFLTSYKALRPYPTQNVWNWIYFLKMSIFLTDRCLVATLKYHLTTPGIHNKKEISNQECFFF